MGCAHASALVVGLIHNGWLIPKFLHSDTLVGIVNGFLRAPTLSCNNCCVLLGNLWTLAYFRHLHGPTSHPKSRQASGTRAKACSFEGQLVRMTRSSNGHSPSRPRRLANSLGPEERNFGCIGFQTQELSLRIARWVVPRSAEDTYFLIIFCFCMK